ncbi:MAG: hypothetical protein AAF810_12135 [Cyanobacteria bacterium P01_D01_bin.36]
MNNSSPSSPSGDDTRDLPLDDAQLNTTKAEMLQSILDAEQSAPWLAGEAAGEYTAQIDAAGQALEISDEEAEKGWQGLSAQLNQIWTGAQVGVQSDVQTSVLALLQEKFAARLPSDLLGMISERAQQVAKSGQPMVKQLITCVQDGLDNIGEADLQVMARPMAFAMRGSSADEFVEATIKSVRQDDWAALSPVEQARLSLAAARYAISQTES